MRWHRSAQLNSAAFDQACNTDLKVTLKAPHYVNWVQAQLEELYGPEVMYKGGLQVTTTLDPAMQAIVEEEAKKQVDALRSKGASNTAVVVMPKSAAARAMRMAISPRFAIRRCFTSVNSVGGSS